MKIYKLIKEFPGSPKLGSIEKPVCNSIHQMSNGNYGYNFEENSTFWEEVVKKDYEILSFQTNKGIAIIQDYNIDYDSKVDKIHSVKRLSDGEIFTIGDEVIVIFNKSTIFNITSFHISEGNKIACGNIEINYIEHVIKKDYEITAYIDQHLKVWEKNNNNKFETFCRLSNYTEKEILATLKTKIHSVKRLSDGEVFTIGDKAITRLSNYGNIRVFEICQNKLYIKSDENATVYDCKIKDLKIIKTPLFRTEDGVNIFEGDKTYSVNRHFTLNAFRSNNGKEPSFVYFSTKEKAEEYILWNKPRLSLREISNCYSITSYGFSRLKELVKTKNENRNN